MMTSTTTKLFPEVEKTIATLETNSLSKARKAVLQPLLAYIQQKHKDHQAIRLNFICTHNSRRSHLAQVWAQVMATYYHIKNVDCYSGGTEATALFPMVAETLQQQGLQIQRLSEDQNPVYAIKYAPNQHPIIGFSKTFEDAFNPSSGFAAIMTCSQADSGCPFIGGAEQRIPITFEDPKAFDNMPQQAEKYLERSLQIATELKYIFSNLV